VNFPFEGDHHTNWPPSIHVEIGDTTAKVVLMLTREAQGVPATWAFFRVRHSSRARHGLPPPATCGTVDPPKSKRTLTRGPMARQGGPEAPNQAPEGTPAGRAMRTLVPSHT